jgi:hypothetical protein
MVKLAGRFSGHAKGAAGSRVRRSVSRGVSSCMEKRATAVSLGTCVVAEAEKASHEATLVRCDPLAVGARPDRDQLPLFDRLHLVVCDYWRRGPFLRGTVVALVAEGALVAANHGDCPLGPLGDRIGDDVPLFELVLPPRAAKAAIPVLGAVAGAGLIALAVRSRREPERPPHVA